MRDEAQSKTVSMQMLLDTHMHRMPDRSGRINHLFITRDCNLRYNKIANENVVAQKTQASTTITTKIHLKIHTNRFNSANFTTNNPTTKTIIPK